MPSQILVQDKAQARSRPFIVSHQVQSRPFAIPQNVRAFNLKNVQSHKQYVQRLDMGLMQNLGVQTKPAIQRTKPNQVTITQQKCSQCEKEQVRLKQDLNILSGTQAGSNDLAITSASKSFIQRKDGPCKDVPPRMPHRLIVRGSVHPDVRDAQRKLNRYHKNRLTAKKQGLSSAPLVEDCIFGLNTHSATIAFQKQVFPKQSKEHDGKIGKNTWAELDKVSEAPAPPPTFSCVTQFRETVHPIQTIATSSPGGTTRIRGHHSIYVLFSNQCNCSEFQYRQFIAGVAVASRGGKTQDLSSLFVHIPGGRLPITFSEDGMTDCAGINYGHREQPPQNSTTANCGENRYINSAGTTDQAHGCIYRGEDFPSITVNGLKSADDVDLLVEFRGEIQHNGRTIQTRNWTTIDTAVRTP